MSQCKDCAGTGKHGGYPQTLSECQICAGSGVDRIREIEQIMEQHGTMTGDTTEQDYDRLSEELDILRGEHDDPGT